MIFWLWFRGNLLTVKMKAEYSGSIPVSALGRLRQEDSCSCIAKVSQKKIFNPPPKYNLYFICLNVCLHAHTVPHGYLVYPRRIKVLEPQNWSDSWELPYRHQEPNPEPLQEQLLTAKPSPSLTKKAFLKTQMSSWGKERQGAWVLKRPICALGLHFSV